MVTSSKILGFNAEGKRTLLWNLKYNLAKKSDENLLEESVLENIEIISEAALVNNVTGQIGYSLVGGTGDNASTNCVGFSRALRDE